MVAFRFAIYAPLTLSKEAGVNEKNQNALSELLLLIILCTPGI